MDRRNFLRAGLAASGGAVALPSITMTAAAQPAGESPYGSIDGVEPDENGVILPQGFTSRIIGVGGEEVGDTGYPWHIFPDGAATFDDGEGGWRYTCNSEIFTPGLGGVSAVHFDEAGAILDAYPILEGSVANCAGGPTPWGTWLSCEEDFGLEQGLVWECDPTGENDAVAHPAMGKWAHEAVAVDPVDEMLYMTQDHPAGLLYRYTPSSYPDLSAGLLEAATIAGDGAVTWSEVPDPSGESAPTREQVAGATTFNGGEGIWYHDGYVYFTTKGDNVVHAIDLRAQVHSEIYRAIPADVEAGTSVLFGVDNITVDAGSGDLFVAEDGGNMEVVIITPDGEVAPFARVPGQDESEITGPVFNPARDRLYFSSQRGPSPKNIDEIHPELGDLGPNAGITFEISGPFRGAVEAIAPSTTTEASTTSAPADSSTSAASTATDVTTTTASPVTTLAQLSEDDDDDGSGNGAAIAVGVGAAIVIAGGAVVALRNRGSKSPDEGSDDELG